MQTCKYYFPAISLQAKKLVCFFAVSVGNIMFEINRNIANKVSLSKGEMLSEKHIVLYTQTLQNYGVKVL